MAESFGLDSVSVSFGIVVGFVAWFLVRYLVAGLYTVDQNERAVKTIFGRARAPRRARPRSTIPIAEYLRAGRARALRYPQVRVIPPGGPYFKWPWEKVHKVSIATADAQHGLRPGGSRRPTAAAPCSKP